MLIAALLMAIGFAFDAGSGGKELTIVFAGTYVIGCIFAVLAVRQAGIFTAVIQPPLLLFGAVPTAYFVFTGSQLTNIKDTLINCAYPLIERFPLMFFTSAVVLLIGMARWYFGMSSHRGTPATDANDDAGGDGLLAAVMSKVSALLAGGEHDEKADEPPRRRGTAERPSQSTSRSGRPASRPAPSRSRHARPPETELVDPIERPRRPRPNRQAEPPIEPRRKPRQRSGQRRAMPPVDRRTGYERPERRRRFEDDQPPLSHSGGNHNGAGNGTHHPVSRVRYRGGEDGEDYDRYRDQYRDQHRDQYRPPRQTARERAVENWEYDI